MKKNKKNYQVSEKQIINLIRILNYNKKETFNFKNDGAYLKNKKGSDIVVTNDTINESIDFFNIDSANSIANKIVTINLSDISSMGACPYTYTLSLNLPINTNIKWIKQFIYKLKSLQKKYNFFLLGGDISTSKKISISANFFGYVKKGKIIKRENAKIGDDIWVSGNLGDSSIGLAYRKNKIKLEKKYIRYYLNKYLFPSPSMIGNKLINIATSSIDISDGFYGDLENLINCNFLGAMVNLKNIPISKISKRLIHKKIIDLNFILTSGDDYELLFTARPDKKNNIKQIAKKNNIKISNVGKIIKKKGIFIDGEKLKLTNKSFLHFF